MVEISALSEKLEKHLSGRFLEMTCAYEELTLIIEKHEMMACFQMLKTHPDFLFNMLIDLSVVDYLHYGLSDWETTNATETGFSRAKNPVQDSVSVFPERFAVVYHFLSIPHRHRLRVKVPVAASTPFVLSVHELWKVANWFEREAYDLFGILFENHPDLRRILTDYGFIGHPFRKDFPLSGHVEMRYDATEQRVIYEPVQIEPRTVPKVIRHDSRYQSER